MSNFRFTSTSNFPPVVKNLIIINVLVFVAQLLLDSQYGLTEKLVLWPVLPGGLEEALRMPPYSVETGKFNPYQLFTHFFSHSPGTFFHILFNMLILWSFGRVMENVWGSKRFLTFYIFCGLGAAALHLGMQYFRATQLLDAIMAHREVTAQQFGALAPALGASGAVMGVMIAFAYTFPNTEMYIMFLPIPIKAKWVALAYVAIDLFGGVANVAGDNIAHFAHLGGALTGFIMVLIWNKTNRRTLY